MLRATLAALIVAAPHPALAQDFTDAQKAAFIAAIAGNGCSLTEEEAPTLLPAAGIDKDTSGAIANYMLDREMATLSEDNWTFTLAAELCP